MAILEIKKYPDLELKKISTAVQSFNNELREFIADLEQTMRSGPGTVGIAAIQVGFPFRITIIDVSSKPKIKNHGRLVLVNPEITAWKETTMGREGCLSVPDYTGNVIRAEQINVSAYDEFGTRHEYMFEGYEARAVQHELDHFEGLLFLDRLVSRRHDLFRRKAKQSGKDEEDTLKS